MNVQEVFMPTGVPTVTYIDREDQQLASQLRNALHTPGMIISLSGPSKTGKTVLINKIIPKDNLIPVSGAAIRTAEGLWDRVLNWMDAPSGTTHSSGHTFTAEIGGKVSGKGNFWVASAESEGSLSGGYARDASAERHYARKGIDQVIKEIANSEFVVFIDDFHYMSRETQNDVARQIKEAAEKGVRICTASVPHRADDVVRSNPELRGRVKAIDFDYWAPEETAAIAERGFRELGITLVPDDLPRRFAAEAFGSPQLMQSICLQACHHLGIEEKSVPPRTVSVHEGDLKRTFELAATTTDFSSLLDALHAGPKQRGTSRNTYDLMDDSKGDVYRCILLALQQDPPKLNFNYDEIYQRTRQVCRGNAPSGSSVAQALEQIHYLSEKIQPSTPVVEWNDDVLDIVDPYFLYYLRCSTRLQKLRRLGSQS